MVMSLVPRLNRFSHTSHWAGNLGWIHQQPPIFPVQTCWIISDNSDYFNRWVCPLLVDINASLNAWERLMSIQKPFGVLGNGGTPSHCLQVYGLPLSQTITSIDSPWLRTVSSFSPHTLPLVSHLSDFSPHASKLWSLLCVWQNFEQPALFNSILT